MFKNICLSFEHKYTFQVITADFRLVSIHSHVFKSTDRRIYPTRFSVSPR
jgi:hypothetical protein